MYPDRVTVSVALLSCVLFLTSCTEPPSETKGELPVVDNPARITDQTVKSTTVSPEPAADAPIKADSSAPEPEHKKPLDLSMPADNMIEFGAVENEVIDEPNLLPDLFDQQQKHDGSPVHMKGRVYLPETQPENGYAIDGGELNIEIETR